MKNEKQQKGFTLIEVAVAVGVIAIVGALAFASFANSRKVRDLVTSGQNTLSILRTAQARAIAGQNNVSWGVRLEQTRFILFSGTSYAASATTTIYTLPSTVEIRNIALVGGGSEIVFRRLDGRTDQAGTFDVGVVNSATQVFSATVDTSGRAYQTGTAPGTTGTRVTDARHRNFVLGWSIQNSTTMTLTFSDPPSADTVSSITMSPAAPRSTYDWSGTVTVGGRDQTLRIHATSVTASNTTLSVDRDCRYNNKKLAIAIDGKAIATYEADCATITLGAFGGTMSEP